ncbi:hypothetical protein Dimus_038800 [Dionaea muscipula]
MINLVVCLFRLYSKIAVGLREEKIKGKQSANRFVSVSVCLVVYLFGLYSKIAQRIKVDCVNFEGSIVHAQDFCPIIAVSLMAATPAPPPKAAEQDQGE